MLRGASGVIGDNGIGRIQDILGRPVVLVENDYRRFGELFFEAHQVTHVGPSESVHALVVIAHDHDVAVLGG